MASVLVVDDQDVIRTMMGAFLRRYGFSVEVAESGTAALLALERRSFDLLITDLLMPDKAGLETIRETARRWPQMRIIAMSGLGGTESGLGQARQLGAHATVIKPFQTDELLNAIHGVLGTTRTDQE